MSRPEVDVHSPTWAAIEAHAVAQIELLRVRNDSPMDAMSTAFVRGQISAWKSVLALGEKAPGPAEKGYSDGGYGY